MPALILLVAGESDLRAAYRECLSAARWDVLEAANAAVALRLVGEIRPSLVVVDGSRPEQRALDLVRQLRADLHYEALPIVILAGPELARECMRAPRLGVDCLLGPVGPRELVVAVRHALRRSKELPFEGAVRLGRLSLDPAGCSAGADGKAVFIGSTECRLLLYLMTHPERVFNRALLVDQVWGDQVVVAERTVDVVVRRLRTQLEAIGCQDMIQTVRGAGYRISAEARPDAG